MATNTRPAALIVALSSDARIEFKGSNWRCVSKNWLGYTLANEVEGNLHLCVGIDEFHSALTRRKAKILWNYHTAGQVKLRERIGGDHRKGFTEHDVMISSFKEHVIIAYEKLLRKRGQVSTREVAASLPEWAAKANKHINTPARLRYNMGQAQIFEVPSTREFYRDLKTYEECGRDLRSLIPLLKSPSRNVSTSGTGNHVA